MWIKNVEKRTKERQQPGIFHQAILLIFFNFPDKT